MKTVCAGQKLYFPWQDNSTLTRNSFYLQNPATDYASKRMKCQYIELQNDETFLCQPFFDQDPVVQLIPLNWYRLSILIKLVKPCIGNTDQLFYGEWDYLAKALDLYTYPGSGPFVAATYQWFLATCPNVDQISQTLVPFLVHQTNRVLLRIEFQQSVKVVQNKKAELLIK